MLHDFGGPFGLQWAAGHPEALGSLTLVNTGVLLDYRWHRLARGWRTPLLGEYIEEGVSALGLSLGDFQRG